MTQHTWNTCATVLFSAQSHVPFMLSTINPNFFNHSCNHYNIRLHPMTLTSIMSLLPSLEAIYPNPKAAFTTIQAHTKHQGYAIKKTGSKASRRLFACNRAGKYDPNSKDLAVHKSKQRTATGSKMYKCLISIEVRLDHLFRQLNALCTWRSIQLYCFYTYYSPSSV